MKTIQNNIHANENEIPKYLRLWFMRCIFLSYFTVAILQSVDEISSVTT